MRLSLRRRSGACSRLPCSRGRGSGTCDGCGRSRRRAHVYVLCLPVTTNDVVIFLIEILAEEKLHDLVNAAAVVERLDERLDDRDRTVVGPGVAPGLEIVFLRDVPVTKLASLVEMRAEVDSKRHLVHTVDVQLQISGRIVNRV